MSRSLASPLSPSAATAAPSLQQQQASSSTSASVANLLRVSKEELPDGVVSEESRSGLNKVVEERVRPALKLIAKIAAYIEIDVLVMLTAQQFAWMIYDLSEERRADDAAAARLVHN